MSILGNEARFDTKRLLRRLELVTELSLSFDKEIDLNVAYNLLSRSDLSDSTHPPDTDIVVSQKQLNKA